jgi:protein-S-isoprenylcysteine O-methyltransferase Ste14
MVNPPLSQKQSAPEQAQPHPGGLGRAFWLRALVAIPFLMAVFFIPAGTLAYWEAWVYMGILLIPMAFVVRYFARRDPAFLERRMHMKERQPQQRWIIALSFIWFGLTFILPGLDHRFGWSEVPVWAVLLADGIVLAGYLFIFRVFRENSYASRVVEVMAGQKVIDTGPYAAVRHPMYVGVAAMYLATPVALGSWWALLPALLIIPLLVARIANEEKVLVAELPGYAAYRERVKYRLIPGVW